MSDDADASEDDVPDALLEDRNARGRTTSLAAGHTLRIERRSGTDVVQVVRGEDTIAVTLHVSEHGVTIDLKTGSLALRTAGELSIDAARLSLRGRDGVEITTDGTLAATAHEQRLRATLGNVEVRANDDVTLDGERVLLNCPEETTPPSPRPRRRND